MNAFLFSCFFSFFFCPVYLYSNKFCRECVRTFIQNFMRHHCIGFQWKLMRKNYHFLAFQKYSEFFYMLLMCFAVKFLGGEQGRTQFSSIYSTLTDFWHCLDFHIQSMERHSSDEHSCHQSVVSNSCGNSSPTNNHTSLDKKFFLISVEMGGRAKEYHKCNSLAYSFLESC